MAKPIHSSPIYSAPTREQEIPAEAQVNPKAKTTHRKDLVPEGSPYFYSAHVIVKYDDDSKGKLLIFRQDHPDTIKSFSMQHQISDSLFRKTAGRAQSMSML